MREVDRVVCRTIYSRRGGVKECNKVKAAGNNENSSSSKCATSRERKEKRAKANRNRYTKRVGSRKNSQQKNNVQEGGNRI